MSLPLHPVASPLVIRALSGISGPRWADHTLPSGRFTGIDAVSGSVQHGENTDAMSW